MSIALKKIIFHENQGMGDFIAKIEVPFFTGTPDFILLLDNTNNMINHFNDIVNEVIPSVFEELNYSNKNVILITFTNQETLSIKQMKSKHIVECDHFNMAGAIDLLKKVFENYNGERAQIRILTLSAGEIDDQITTKYKIDALVKSFSQQFLINSQGIRLMVTENANPETRALCSMLRLTNITSKKTELLELTPFREEDYIEQIINSPDYENIERNCETDKYNLSRNLSNECDNINKIFFDKIETIHKERGNSKEYKEFVEKLEEIKSKMHYCDCPWNLEKKIYEKFKNAKEIHKNDSKVEETLFVADISDCVACKRYKKGIHDSNHDKQKPVEECELCRNIDLSKFGHKFERRYYYKGKRECLCLKERIRKEDIKENYREKGLVNREYYEETGSEEEDYDSNEETIENEERSRRISNEMNDKTNTNNKKSNDIENKSSQNNALKSKYIAYGEPKLDDKLELYKDILDELLQLQILKINRDNKINNFQYKNFGKIYLKLIREIRITRKAITLPKEDENENPEKERIRNEINGISTDYQSKIDSIKNEKNMGKLEKIIDEYIDEIKKKILKNLNTKENQEKIKEINENYYEKSDEIIYRILYKNYEKSIDDFKKYRNYKDIVFKRNYQNTLDEKDLVENLSEERQKLFDKQNIYQYNINCEKEEKEIDKIWTSKMKDIQKNFDQKVKEKSNEATKKGHDFYPFVPQDYYFYKFREIEKAVYDLSLSYYYYCKINNKNIISNKIEETKNNLIEQKNIFEKKLEMENISSSERYICKEMLEKINNDLEDLNGNDSLEESEEDIKNFRKIYLELYFGKIKEENNKKLGHEMIKKIDKYSIVNIIKNFEKKTAKKVNEQKYDFQNPYTNNLYAVFYSNNKNENKLTYIKPNAFDNLGKYSTENAKYCHIIWNKSLCQIILKKLLTKYINYDYNHLFYSYKKKKYKTVIYKYTQYTLILKWLDVEEYGRGSLSDKTYKKLYEECENLKSNYEKLDYLKYGKRIRELRNKMEENIDKYNEKKKNELEKIDKKYEKEREDCIKKKFDELKKDVNSNLIGIICALFENDGLNSDTPFILETDEKTLKNNPQDKPTNKIILNGGTNTIFCQDKPKSIKASNSSDNEINLNIEEGEGINAYNYIEIIGKNKITYIIQKSSINKIADTEDSRNESTDISEYFSSFDNTLDDLENTLDGSNLTISSLLNDINSTNTDKIDNKNMNEFIQEKIKLSEKKICDNIKPLTNTDDLYFVLIMDTSDDMKNDIKNTQKIIHKFLNKLGYQDNQEMTILTFNNKSIDLDIEDLPTTKLKTKGGREITEIFSKLRNIIKENLDKKFQFLFFISGKIEDEDNSQIEAYKLKNEINNKIIIQTNVMQYKTEEKKKEKNSDLYSETTHALLRNISSVATDMNAKFTTMYYNDTEDTKIKKLMNMFCSYKNRADLKLEKKNSTEGLIQSINICDLNYKNGNIQDRNEEQEKIEKIRQTLIKAFKDI